MRLDAARLLRLRLDQWSLRAFGDYASRHPCVAGCRLVILSPDTRHPCLCVRADVRALLEAGEPFFEVPFTLQDASVMVRGTVDCLVRRSDGGVSVLEFKTGARRPGPLGQLSLHRRAAKLLFPGTQVDEPLVYVRGDAQ